MPMGVACLKPLTPGSGVRVSLTFSLSWSCWIPASPPGLETCILDICSSFARCTGPHHSPRSLSLLLY